MSAITKVLWEHRALPLVDRILKGVALIRSYEPGAEISAQDGAIFFGHYWSRERMTGEERAHIEAWGWYQEGASWAHICPVWNGE